MRKAEMIYDTDCPNVEAARAPSVVEIVGKAVPLFWRKEAEKMQSRLDLAPKYKVDNRRRSLIGQENSQAPRLAWNYRK